MCSENHPQSAGWGWGTERTVWNSLIFHCILLFFTTLPLKCIPLTCSDTFSLGILFSYYKSLLLNSSASCSSGKRTEFSWLDFCRREFNANAAWGQRIGERCSNAVLHSKTHKEGCENRCIAKWWCRIWMTGMQSKKVQSTLKTSHALKTAAVSFLCFVALIGHIKFILQTRVRHKRQNIIHVKNNMMQTSPSAQLHFSIRPIGGGKYYRH